MLSLFYPMCQILSLLCFTKTVAVNFTVEDFHRMFFRKLNRWKEPQKRLFMYFLPLKTNFRKGGSAVESNFEAKKWDVIVSEWSFFVPAGRAPQSTTSFAKQIIYHSLSFREAPNLAPMLSTVQNVSKILPLSVCIVQL